MGEPERKKPLGRPRRRWEDNIKIAVGCGEYGLDRAGSGYGQVAGTYECCNKTSGSIKCAEYLTGCKTVSFSRRTLLHRVNKHGVSCYRVDSI